ncbi:MAG: nickel pincer cofactor biosynthesis protein LarB [Candidatus Omnitrophica bacterium]|jgi:hypothetical protein|nr:nickel pincer cofactor biosynthesis protein LarB [Candidatus Omnitrophota bacterium]
MNCENSGFCDLGFAKLDTNRRQRRGYPEAVYSPGKNKKQLKEITAALLKNKEDVILTRLDRDKFSYLKKFYPSLKYSGEARLAFITFNKPVKKHKIIAVVCAGTSDIPIAEEAAIVAEIGGSKVKRLYDVGVAGVHRLFSNIDIIKQANVIIVVAGMEGALASLVSGLVKSPVIAVPTSCGYGASFQGLSALLTMLNACSAGITVVNIDNGFGAGYFANLINK